MADHVAVLERNLQAAGEAGTAHRYPLARFYRLVGPIPEDELALRVGCTRRTIARWRALGSVSVWMADRLACSFNLHPSLVWPEWWDVEPGNR